MDTRLLVTGATGTIGRRLMLAFSGARALSRDPTRAASILGQVAVSAWDGRSIVERSALEGVQAIVHLAGEPIAEGGWSKEKKQRIRDSRVLGTRAMVRSLAEASPRPAVLVCASAAGYYGDRGEEPLDETSSAGSGFLAEVCEAWEREALEASALGIRVVCLRFGVVLDRAGGGLPRMIVPFRFGLGGPLGSGQQWVPWIHVTDVIRIVRHAIDEQAVSGPVNVVGAEAARSVDIARALGRVLHRPARVHTPAFVLRALMGQAADVLLASQRVTPMVAGRTGFRFAFGSVFEALSDLLAGDRHNRSI